MKGSRLMYKYVAYKDILVPLPIALCMNLHGAFYFYTSNTTNMKNFQICGGDIDHTIYDRIITGRLTRRRYEIIMRYARIKSRRLGNCGHEWDCCGCLHATYMDVKFIGSMIYLQYTQHFNY